MRGVSRASLVEASERLDAALSSTDAATLGDELFAVLHVLDREHVLRRSLSDPSRPMEQRAQIARMLLEGKIAPSTLDLVADVVRLRWTRPSELSDAVERLAATTVVASAEATGRLDDLEDELFRFGRIVAARPELRLALSGSSLPPEGKAELLSTLLVDKVAPATLCLVTEVTTHRRGRTLDRGLEEYGRIAAERRSRLIAVVRTAVELTERQKTRLVAALTARYDRDIHLNIEVDPTVLGGMSVQIGDEEIDGTIARRLDDVRRRLRAIG